MYNPDIGSSQDASTMENPCMSYPEIRSSQHASSMEKPSRLLGGVKPLPFRIVYPADYDPNVERARTTRRSNRKCDAIRFRRDYAYDESFEQKTCIWSGDTYSWQDKSSGIMWVGVHGMDSICVVTMTGDVDMTRVRGGLGAYTKETVLRVFRKTLISELEDLGSTLRQRFDKSIKKPFGVVSVVARTDEVHKESGHEASSDDDVKIKPMNFFMEKFINIQPPTEYDVKEIMEFEILKRDLASTLKETIQASSSFAVYDEKKAIKFLQEKMNSNMDLTVNETIQTAISAFQHLLQKKFKANEIEVSVMDPCYKVYGRDAISEREGIKVLEIIDIKEHLAIVNEPSILWAQKLIPVVEAPKAEHLAIINGPKYSTGAKGHSSSGGSESGTFSYH